MLENIVKVINSSEIKFHINVQVKKDLDSAKENIKDIQNDVKDMISDIEKDISTIDINELGVKLKGILSKANDTAEKLDSVSSGMVLDININKKEGENENDK